jgi:hypothetical protein
MRKIFLNSLSAVALAAAMGAVTGAATAQVPPPPPAEAPPPHDMDGPFDDGPDRNADLTRAAFVDARVARLTALDADHDGTVSVAEREAAMQAKRAERADERFAKLDANSDGSISRAEFEVARPDRAERADGDDRGPRRERGPGRGGPRQAMRGPGGPEGPGGRGPEGREPGPVVIAEVASTLGERFDKTDADHNGVVTAEERRAAMSARRADRPHHRSGPRPGQQPASPPPASE